MTFYLSLRSLAVDEACGADTADQHRPREGGAAERDDPAGAVSTSNTK
jgi:hypothetical protein